MRTLKEMIHLKDTKTYNPQNLYKILIEKMYGKIWKNQWRNYGEGGIHTMAHPLDFWLCTINVMEKNHCDAVL